MGVEDACARETRVATKAYDLWIGTGNPDATYNWYRAVVVRGCTSPECGLGKTSRHGAAGTAAATFKLIESIEVLKSRTSKKSHGEDDQTYTVFPPSALCASLPASIVVDPHSSPPPRPSFMQSPLNA